MSKLTDAMFRDSIFWRGPTDVDDPTLFTRHRQANQEHVVVKFSEVDIGQEFISDGAVYTKVSASTSERYTDDVHTYKFGKDRRVKVAV